MQPEKTAVLREWLEKSRQDLSTAQHLLKTRPDLSEPSCFHAQQCAEKILKAFLIWKDIRPWKTHDIEEIGNKVLGYEPSLGALLKQAQKLSDYAVTSRYPGEDDPPTAEEAECCVKLAQEVYERVLKKLPVESHPK